MEALKQFFNDPAGIAALGMLGLAALDTIMGIWAALKDGSFQLSAVAAVLAKHVQGRVIPVTILLAGGYFLGVPALVAGGAAAATAYTAETIGSLLESIGQATGSTTVAPDEVPQG